MTTPTTNEVESFLEQTVEKVGGAFLVAFFGSVSAAGMNIIHLSTVEAAAAAGVAAGVAALDTVIGNVIHPGASSIYSAVKERLTKS